MTQKDTPANSTSSVEPIELIHFRRQVTLGATEVTAEFGLSDPSRVVCVATMGALTEGGRVTVRIYQDLESEAERCYAIITPIDPDARSQYMAAYSLAPLEFYEILWGPRKASALPQGVANNNGAYE